MFCNVCLTELGTPLYESDSDQALTSLCQLRTGQVRVWLCTACGHLCGEPLADNQIYYESDYRILLDSDEEDQVYEVADDRIVYRTEHQLVTLIDKLDIPKQARLLDYGCAKASTPKKLLESRPDLQLYLYDVSAMYVLYWQQFLDDNRWAIHEVPVDWHDSFDVVTSFFALEHMPEPLSAVSQIYSLLESDGVFYGVVPDTFGNVADFVVIDHTSHFTKNSLHALLRKAGFVEVKIDSDVHRGALVFTARKAGTVFEPTDLNVSIEASHQLAYYWKTLNEKIRLAETIHNGQPAVIYGSGFYGAYIASLLRDPEQVMCFLDASPFQQGKTLLGRMILPPHHIPSHARLLYVGLNPKIARSIVASMDWLQNQDISLVFLDECEPC